MTKEPEPFYHQTACNKNAGSDGLSKKLPPCPQVEQVVQQPGHESDADGKQQGIAWGRDWAEDQGGSRCCALHGRFAAQSPTRQQACRPGDENCNAAQQGNGPWMKLANAIRSIDDAKRQCCPADHLREDGPGDEGGKQC